LSLINIKKFKESIFVIDTLKKTKHKYLFLKNIKKNNNIFKKIQEKYTFMKNIKKNMRHIFTTDKFT